MEAIDYKTNWYETKPNYKEFDAENDYWSMKYSDRWESILRLMTLDLDFWELSVLDIGSGLGRALSYFKKQGAKEVLGVEPSEFACKNSRLLEHEQINDYFLNAKIEKKFDVIHIEQVLSHMPNAKENLLKAKSLLKDTGVMVIEEPNDGSPLQKGLNKGEYWKCSDHVNYWTFDSFETLLNECGLKVLRKTCTYPMELFEYFGEHYLGNEAKGREVHFKRYELEKNLGYKLRNDMWDMFANKGWGRDLIFFTNKGVL